MDKISERFRVQKDYIDVQEEKEKYLLLEKEERLEKIEWWDKRPFLKYIYKIIHTQLL